MRSIPLLSKNIAVGNKCVAFDEQPETPFMFEMDVPIQVVTSHGVSVTAAINIQADFPRCFPIENTRRGPDGRLQTRVRFFAPPTEEALDDEESDDELVDECDSHAEDPSFDYEEPENSMSGWIPGFSSVVGGRGPSSEGLFFEVYGGVYRLQLVCDGFFIVPKNYGGDSCHMFWGSEVKIGFGELDGELYLALSLDDVFAALAHVDVNHLLATGCKLPNADLAHGDGILLELIGERERVTQVLRYVNLGSDFMADFRERLEARMTNPPRKAGRPRVDADLHVGFPIYESVIDEGGWEVIGRGSPFIDAWLTEEGARDLIAADNVMLQTIAVEGKRSVVDEPPKAPSSFELNVPLDLVTSYGVSVNAEIAISAKYPSSYPMENTRKCPSSAARTRVRFFAPPVKSDIESIVDDEKSDDDPLEDWEIEEEEPCEAESNNFDPGWVAAVAGRGPSSEGCFFGIIGGVYRLQVVANGCPWAPEKYDENFTRLFCEEGPALGFGELDGELYVFLDLGHHFAALGRVDVKHMFEMGDTLPSPAHAHGNGILLELIDAENGHSEAMIFITCPSEFLSAFRERIIARLANPPIDVGSSRAGSGFDVAYSILDAVSDKVYPAVWSCQYCPFIDAWVTEQTASKLMNAARAGKDLPLQSQL
jgi:hypothetical protein